MIVFLRRKKKGERKVEKRGKGKEGRKERRKKGREVGREGGRTEGKKEIMNTDFKPPTSEFCTQTWTVNISEAIIFKKVFSVIL